MRIKDLLCLHFWSRHLHSKGSQGLGGEVSEGSAPATATLGPLPIQPNGGGMLALASLLARRLLLHPLGKQFCDPSLPIHLRARAASRAGSPGASTCRSGRPERRRIGAMEISNSGKTARDGLAGAVDRGGAVRVRVMDHGRKDGGSSSMPSKRSTCGMLGT